MTSDPEVVVVSVEDLRLAFLPYSEHNAVQRERDQARNRLRALLPCPAEGLTNSQHHPRPRTVGDGFHAIVCICGVSGPESATEKNALDWWNTLPRRADTPAKGES